MSDRLSGLGMHRSFNGKPNVLGRQQARSLIWRTCRHTEEVKRRILYARDVQIRPMSILQSYSPYLLR